MTEPTSRPRLPFVPILGLLVLLGSTAVAGSSPASSQLTAELARRMAEAEGGLAESEHQIAESRFRSALYEGWLLKGALAVAEGRADAAQECFEQAAVSAAETRRALTALAYLELDRGEAERAVALLRRVVSRDPTSGSARRQLAQALIADGRLDEAVQELEEVVGAVPEDLESAFALASGYLKLGKVEEAQRLFELIASERPIPASHVLIGRTYRDARLFERARGALETALRLDPGARRAHYYLGTVALLERGSDGLAEGLERFERELERYPDDPMTNLYYGMALAESRRFVEALPALRIATEWAPTRLDALRFLGRSQLGLDRPQEAKELLERALALAESEGARPRQRSFILYQLGSVSRRLGSRADAERYFAEAESVSAEIIAGERDRLSDFFAEADRGLEGGAAGIAAPPEIERVARLDAAARQALAAAVDTALVRAYFNLGVLDARERRLAEAIDHFEAAARIDPFFPRLARSLGTAAFQAQRFEPAARWLSRAVESAPDDADLRRMLALSWLNLGSYERAAQLLADDPMRDADPSLRYAYALSLVRSDQMEQAEAVFRALMAEHGNWPPLYVLLGQAHARQGAFDQAIRALDQALALDPRVAEAHLTRGNIFLKRGELAEAEEAFRAELALRPEDPAARYLLAVVLDLAQQPEAAVAELERVLFVQPENADARYLLGKIRLAGGQADEALLHLEAAAALAPGDANVRYQLALAYQRLGKVEQANREFASYRELKSDRPEPPP